MEREFENNISLLKRAKDGDESAAEELVRLNMGLVKSIAVRFRERGVEYDDLIQLGSIGMLKAIRSFDFDRNTAFSTYAVPLIIGEIRRFIRDDGIIKVSRIYKKNALDLMRAREAFIRENSREPRLDEIAHSCGLSPEEAAIALDSAVPVSSLSASVNGDDDDFSLESVLSDGTDEIDVRTENIALSEAVSSLSPLWRKIIVLRYLKDFSQQETARLLGLSQVKISREEKKIFEHLRSRLKY